MNNEGITGPIGQTLKENAKMENDLLPEYWKSLGLTVSHDWDRKYKWYECYKDHKLLFQVEMGVTVDQFINALVENFTIPDKIPTFFIAGGSTNEEVFEKCILFPEFNERIKGVDIII